MADNQLATVEFGRALKNKQEVVHQSLIATTANIIGTSFKGPAFIPQKLFGPSTIGDTQVYNTLNNTLGEDRQNRFEHLYDTFTCNADSDAYLAASTWLANGKNYASFTRVLGVGTNSRDPITQKMLGSGFNASKNISSGTLDHTRSRYLNAVDAGDPGSVGFLFRTITEKSKRDASVDAKYIDITTVDYLNELGHYIDATGSDSSKDIEDSNLLTDVYIFASGVLPSLTTTKSTEFSSDAATFDNIGDHALTDILDSWSEVFINLEGFKPRFLEERSNGVITKNINYYKPSNDDDVKDNFVFLAQITEEEEDKKTKKQASLFNRVSNKFSERFFEKGYFNYASFDFNGIEDLDEYSSTKILVTKDYNTLTEAQKSSVPDYNSWESEYTTARTPWVTSQPVNRNNFGSVDNDDNRIDIHEKVVNLFRFWSLDDGEVGNRFRVKINITKRGDTNNSGPDINVSYAKFDLYIFEYDPSVNNFIDPVSKVIGPVEVFEDLDLNPDSSDYIGRQVGTKHRYYDLDAGKIIEKGLYENRSQYLRVEINSKIDEKLRSAQYSLLPSGFRSYPHIKFAKDAFLHYSPEGAVTKGINLNNTFDAEKVYQLPPHYNLSYYVDKPLGLNNSILNNWGITFTGSKISNDKHERRFNSDDNTDAGEAWKHISPHYYYSKYFLSGITNEYSYKNIWVEEDNYLNSFFHLEKIYVTTELKTGASTLSIKDIRNSVSQHEVRYKHSGRPTNNVDDIRYLNLSDDICWEADTNDLVLSLKNKLSFDFFTFGGFDGVDLRDSDKKNLRNDSIVREIYDENEDLATTTSYELGIDIATDYSNCAGDILVVPGIKEERIIRKCIQICENDRRHFYIADISGAASNTLIQFNDARDLDQDDDGTFGEESGDQLADYTLQTSRGVMGKQYIVSNDLSYTLDRSSLVEDTRFRLTEVNNPKFGDDITYYNYKSVLDKQYSNIISSWNGLDITSRYILPVLGDLELSNTADNTKRHVKPEIFYLGRIAQTINPRENLTSSNIVPINLSNSAPTYSLINNVYHLANDEDFEKNTKELKASGINIIYKDTSADPVKLLSQSTPYEIRGSVFRDQGVVRTIQDIKKRVKFDLFTNERLVRGGVLFSQNASLENLYSKIEIQLNNLLSTFVEERLINGFYVRIQKATDDKTMLDMQNYIIRGDIILQMNSSDTITLALDDLLNDLSLLSDPASDVILMPSI